MGGTFRFVDEKGIPLEIVVERLHGRGWMMDWLDFYRDSVKQGWPKDRTIGRLREAVGDVYGPEWADEWHRRMLHHAERLEEHTPP
jgi:hypothetical protein